MEVPSNQKDKIVVECPFCARPARISNLDYEQGNEFHVPGTDHRMYWSSYYYCPCDSNTPLVFDPGNQEDLRLREGVQIVVTCTAA